MADKRGWHRVWLGGGKRNKMEETGTQPGADVQDEIREEAAADNAQTTTPEAEDPQATPDSAGDNVSAPETDWQDKYMRLYAEFDNFRKRSMREKADLIRNASKDVVEKMLPILDDFERAMKADGDLESVREGSRLIHDKLINTLTAQGLKPMSVSKGDTFDVEWHEAITRIPAPEPELVGKVVDVVEQGYHLNDGVLRYAKVVVGS